MNFLLYEMTFLKYFVPVMEECIKRGRVCRIFLKPNSKYNNPTSEESLKIISDLAKNASGYVTVHSHESVKDFPGEIFVTVEGVGSGECLDNQNVSAIIYQTDFVGLMPGYESSCDQIFFTSKKYASFYGFESDKNQYFGSPKFDNIPTKEEVISRWSELDPDENYCLVLYPRTRDHNKVDLSQIYSVIRSLGYKIIVKTRGKDPVQNKDLRGDIYIEDGTWSPHPTVEMLKVSDFMINFDSTAIEESVMLRVPVINFRVKPFSPMLPFLYDYDYCRQIVPGLSSEEMSDEIKKAVKHAISKDFTEDFDKALKENLYSHKEASKKIVDFLVKNV